MMDSRVSAWPSRRLTCEAMHTNSDLKPPNDEDRRLLRLYGKIPARGDLLQHQLEVLSVMPRCHPTSLDLADHIHSKAGNISIPATSLSRRLMGPLMLGPGGRGAGAGGGGRGRGRAPPGRAPAM